MTIALVTNAAATSGVGGPALNLARTLRGAGHTVDVYMLDARSSVVRKNETVVARIRPFLRFKPIAWMRLGRTLDCTGYDVVHLANQTLSFLAGRFPTPTVMTVWDLIEREEPQEPGGALAARLLYRGIPRAAHVMVPSQATAAALRRLYRVPETLVTIVPPAVEPVFRFHPDIWNTPDGRRFLQQWNLTPDRPRILYVGSAHPRKNLQRLLEAIAHVSRRLPDVEFVKAGDPGLASARTAFLKTVAALGLHDRVRCVDEVRRDQLPYWYHAARVFAFPTLAEGFGIPPLEAMACGTPVVTSRQSSLPEVVGNAAVLVDPQDTSAIAKALTRVLTDPALREDLRRRGLARAAEFSEDRWLRETLDVYERAIQSAHAVVN